MNTDTLDELGYTPEDLNTFIEINDECRMQNDEFSIPHSSFCISKYLVTNAQYARFLTPENFANADLWTGFPQFGEWIEPEKDQDKKSCRELEEKADGWGWLGKQEKDKGILYPRYWNDPRFGLARRNAPVVGISWYEANVYCKWLMENWVNLEEGQQGLPKPQMIRLPLENEWVLAAGGAENNRFAFGALKNEKEITRFANTSESGINRTTPVWMFPQGKSQPYEIMDMSGNVFEWQGNYRSEKNNYLALRGGIGPRARGSFTESYPPFSAPPSASR